MPHIDELIVPIDAYQVFVNGTNKEQPHAIEGAALELAHRIRQSGGGSPAGNLGKVAELDGLSFEPSIFRHEALVVMFYAPWCRHCQKAQAQLAQAVCTSCAAQALEVAVIMAFGQHLTATSLPELSLHQALELASKHSVVRFAQVDAEKWDFVADENGVDTLPAILAYVNGHAVDMYNAHDIGTAFWDWCHDLAGEVNAYDKDSRSKQSRLEVKSVIAASRRATRQYTA